MQMRSKMLLKITIFFASIVCGFAQFFPGGGMAYGGGQAMAQSPRAMGDFYPMGGYPYVMPQVPRYMPNFYPAPGHFPSAVGYGAASVGAEPSPLPLMSASENTNENANTNVNINSGSYRRSLHSPSKEHGMNRNSNKNTNVNMAS